MAHLLQSFVFPDTTLCSDVDLYFHRSPGAHYLFSERQLAFSRDGEVLCDTYFNSFSVGKWKRHSRIDSLVFRVRLQGRFIIRFGENRPHASARVLHEVRLESQTPTWHDVELPYDRMSNGTLFARFICTSESGVVSEACFATHTPPRSALRVAVVITTFNRKEHIQANLARLDAAMTSDAALRSRLHIVVVDNGSNLDLASTDGLTYLKNANLGGAGGFSRGLLHVRERGGFTHVLFMDDDISFEVESIRRAIAFVAFARDERLCVSGAMFVDSKPHEQFEAGASFQFESPTRLLDVYGAKLDMRGWENVMLNDAFDRHIGYGAWWFFLFPADMSGSDLAFPVFVRGDDMLFSYKYAGGNIVTMNGVCVWHMAFDYKDSATTLYYNLRNMAVVRAVAARPDLGVWPALAYFVWTTLRDNLTYRYVTAEYHIRAMEDFLRGPEWWKTLDLTALNAELRAGDTEVPRALPFEVRRECVDYYEKNYEGSRVRWLAQLLTLNGHLLPQAMLSGRGARRWLALQRRGYSATFGQRDVVFWYEPTGEGFVAEHSKARFFRNLRQLGSTAFRLLRRYRDVRDAYRAAYPDMVSPIAWRRRFDATAALDVAAAPSKRDAAA